MKKAKDLEIYEQIVQKIISETKRLFGRVAVFQANKVKGLQVSENQIKITGDPLKVLSDLAKIFEKIIGPTARTIIIRAVQPLLQKYKLRGKVPDWFFSTLEFKFGKYIENF